MRASTTTNSQQPTTDNQQPTTNTTPRAGHHVVELKDLYLARRRPFSRLFGDTRSWPRVAVAGDPRSWPHPGIALGFGPPCTEVLVNSHCHVDKRGLWRREVGRRIIDKVMDVPINKAIMNLMVPALRDRRREAARTACLGSLGGEEYPDFHCEALVECTVHSRRFGCPVCPCGRHGEVQATGGF